MPTILPKDSENIPIPALRLKDGGAHTITVTSSSSRNSTAFSVDTRVVSVYATGPVYLKFGSSSVTAASTDHYFPAGVYYDVATGGGKSGRFTHVAAIRAEQDCKLYISEKE